MKRKHSGLTAYEPTITTTAGKAYTWRVAPLTRIVTFYDGGRVLGVVDFDLAIYFTGPRLGGCPVTDELREVYKIFKNTERAHYENDCV